MAELEEWVEAREIVLREMNSLRGRLCSAIESIGLASKQERAIITMIKQSSYQQQYTLVELVETLAPENKMRFRYTGTRLEKS